MTGLLLATLLNLSPGIQLIDNIGARNVALSDARFRPLLVSEDERTPRPMFEQMTREQLVNELRRIDESRPGLGGPIALLAVGVALIIPGGGVTIAGLIGLIASLRTSAMVAFTTASAIVLGVGVVMVGVGIILAIVGGVSLGVRIKDRALNGREADEVRRRIDALDNGQPLPVPVPSALPPPPQANFVVPGAMQTVMTF
jgi:hypothetical protein